LREGGTWVSGLGGCGGCLVLFGVVRVVSGLVPHRSSSHCIVVACILHNRGFLRDSGTAPPRAPHLLQLSFVHGNWVLDIHGGSTRERGTVVVVR